MRTANFRLCRLEVVVFAFLALALPVSIRAGDGTALADNIPQSGPGTWIATKAQVTETHISGYCFDPHHPTVVLVSDAVFGTVAYDWHTGQRTVLSTHPFASCGPNGYVYASQDDSQEVDNVPVLRFSLDHPTEILVDHAPSYVAMDGTNRVYFSHEETLLESPDAGLTWQNIGDTLPGPVLCYSLSDVDSHLLYAVIEESTDDGPAYLDPYEGKQQNEQITHYRVYFSSDAGATWEKRGLLDTYSGENGSSALNGINVLPGRNSSIQALTASISVGLGFDEVYWMSMLSTDGGRFFTCVSCDTQGYGLKPLAHTNEGMLETNFGRLQLSTNGGTRWDTMPLPDGRPVNNISVLPQYPYMVFADQQVTDPGHLSPDRFVSYYSTDGANTWHQSTNASAQILPFLPMRSFMVRNGRFYLQNWSGIGKSLLARAAQNWVPSGTYFFATGHNLFGEFKQYWDAHGGIAQLGYPITEPFPEVSLTDGKAYMAQYFERAALELHVGDDGTSTIASTLLGVRDYRARYGPAGAPGQQPSTENPLKFPSTGYTTGGEFRSYWESHGGLAQFGYPISNEFTETSATDGKPYTVQYFQRAEFELHPGQAGTPGTVELSQLGRQLFDSRYSR